MSKGFKITDIDFSQQVNLPAGVYTYSCSVLPVGTSYTFRIGTTDYTFEGLTAGVKSGRIRHTFELDQSAVAFFPSRTVGDCVYVPQIEEGQFATTPGPNLLDYERLISEAGIEIDSEVLSLYAKKEEVAAQIRISADAINSTVGSISNDILGIKSDITSIEQTTASITATVTNHTTQISTFQQTVSQIYLAIEDIGSGEFASILARLDGLDLKVGNAEGAIGQLQISATEIAGRVTNAEGQISTFQQTVDQIYLAIEDVGSGEFSSILARLDGLDLKVGNAEGAIGQLQISATEIAGRVTTAEGHISTFQQTVDQIYLAIEDVGSGEFSSILARLDGLDLKVGNAEGAIGQLQISATEIAGRVTTAEGDITAFQQTATSIAARVETAEGILAQITLEDGTIQIIAKDLIKLEGYTTINDNFQVLPDGSIVANNGEFKGGIKQPFVDVSESTIENYWNTDKTSWACNFFEETPFASLPIRVIPCRSVLNGQIFRFHARRRGIILQPEVSYKFYENGSSLNEIVLAAGDAIEMISISIDNVFKSWDIIRRYKCRKYNE